MTETVPEVPDEPVQEPEQPAPEAPAVPEPIPVADQKAAGVAPEDTVTMADQKAGVPPPEMPVAPSEPEPEPVPTPEPADAPSEPDTPVSEPAGDEPPRDEFTAAAEVPAAHHVRLGDVLSATANFFARNPALEKALLTELASAFKALEHVQ